MLLSLALIIGLGLLVSTLFKFINLPTLIGMIIVGIILGPCVLNVLDPKLLSISSEIREVALIIILIRAGLNLDINELRKVGRSAILMCFIPAVFEIAAISILGPYLLGISFIESLLIGSIVAAVSPAVVVPRMLKLKETGYGNNKSIPEMIMASASIDDVIVIVFFTVFLSLNQTGTFDSATLLRIPTSIILGILVGILLGLILMFIYNKFHIRDTIKVIIILIVGFCMVSIEDLFVGIIGFSGLLAIMSIGATINIKKQKLSYRLSNKFSKIWIVAEILLFTFVGSSVDITYILSAGFDSIVLIILCTSVRFFSVFICLIKTKLNAKEKIFVALSYIPKATVQAAIGSIPLNVGLSIGNIALVVAILSILITAPIGALLIDKTYTKLLQI